MNTLSDMKSLIESAASGRSTQRADRLTRLALFCALALLVAPAHAITITSASWNSGFAAAGAIPDGNVTGWSDTRTLSGILDNSILDVNVTLELSGGWNGDIYGYLTHASGFSVLLNRSGVIAGDAFGYSDAGMKVTLDDSAANGDIHRYQLVGGYATAISNGSAWAPDGRNISPLAVLDTDPRTALLGAFNGLDPNGDWTLFLADVSNGENSTVVSWGLELKSGGAIAAVPEAGSTVVMLLFAVGVISLMTLRRTTAPSASGR